MPGGSSVSDPYEEEIRFRKGANWIPENVKTLMRWIHISAIYIDILGESTKLYKRILRISLILNLILSSFASTVAISQYSDVARNYPSLDWTIKALTTLATVIITLNAGYLKVYNIQEKVEKSIRLQQQWIEFGTTLSSELQLPVEHRKDALYFIIKMKDTYAQLIKQHIVANRKLLKKIAIKNGVAADVLTLSDLLERTIQSEAARIEEEEGKASQASQASQQQQSPQQKKRRPSLLENKDVAIQIKPAPFVPAVGKLLQAKQNLRKVSILASPRTSITNYVMEPTSVRTEQVSSPFRRNTTALPPIYERVSQSQRDQRQGLMAEQQGQQQDHDDTSSIGSVSSYPKREVVEV